MNRSHPSITSRSFKDQPTPTLSGVGVGLRQVHIEKILRDLPKARWFEVLVDNHMLDDTSGKQDLDKIAANYPIAFHSVGVSLGSTDSLNQQYLQTLKQMVDRYQPKIISEHLCWTSAHGIYFHDLLPLPYTQAVASHVADRIEKVQDFLGRQILIENVSSYLNFKQSEMTEWQFLSAVALKSGCGILFDVNNVVVSAYNNGFAALDYLHGLPAHLVGQMHLAGYEKKDGFLLDSHSCEPAEDVWSFYQQAVGHLGPIPTLIEWDENIPDFDVLLKVANRAQDMMYERSASAAKTV
jgi:uncharacterized protein (UPF0276 family)